MAAITGTVLYPYPGTVHTPSIKYNTGMIRIFLIKYVQQKPNPLPKIMRTERPDGGWGVFGFALYQLSTKKIFCPKSVVFHSCDVLARHFPPKRFPHGNVLTSRLPHGNEEWRRLGLS